MSSPAGTLGVAAACSGEAGGMLRSDAREVAPAGAAPANGMTIGAVEARDGSRPTVQPVGCGSRMALSAAMPSAGLHETPTTPGIVCEVGTRAHVAAQPPAPDCRTSGARTALDTMARGGRAPARLVARPAPGAGGAGHGASHRAVVGAAVPGLDGGLASGARCGLGRVRGRAPVWWNR